MVSSHALFTAVKKADKKTQVFILQNNFRESRLVKVLPPPPPGLSPANSVTPQTEMP